MKFEMTKCNQCGSEMLMGADICPSCGMQQSRVNRVGSFQPRTMLAVALAAAVLLIFNWMKAPPPQASQISSPSGASVPSR
jgi:hypothetical protein